MISTTFVAMSRRIAISWGWLGALGLLSIVAAATLQVLSIQWHQQEKRELEALASIRSDLRALRRQQDSEAATAKSRTSPRLWANNLPRESRRQERLADLIESAIKQGLTVQRMEQAMSFEASSGTESLRIVLPMVGTYGQVREFLESALRGDQALSLDSVRIRRASPQTATVEADITLTLHARRESDK